MLTTSSAASTTAAGGRNLGGGSTTMDFCFFCIRASWRDVGMIGVAILTSGGDGDFGAAFFLGGDFFATTASGILSCHVAGNDRAFVRIAGSQCRRRSVSTLVSLS